MADSMPLLSDSDKPPEPKRPPRSLDETIERCIGGFGWLQIFQAILVSFAWVFDAQQTFISVFTDAEPSWHCTDESVCNGFSSICQLPKSSWSWDWPAHTSIISEWGHECSTSFITGLPASSFFMGCLVALRFINGFGRATVGTCALVLSTELVGKRWRGQVGVIGFFCFTLGFLSLPAMAYVNRGSSWRTLYLWISVPTILYCILVHFLVPESPRWLFVKGRKEEAVTTLKGLAQTASALTMSFSNVLIEQESWDDNVDIYSSIRILLNKRWASQRLTAVMVTGFGIGMVYYGMPLGLGNLSVNLYLGVTLNALSELPASLITFFLIDSDGADIFLQRLRGVQYDADIHIRAVPHMREELGTLDGEASACFRGSVQPLLVAAGGKIT
ncbi:Organic cation/carnitine transporter 2 [Hibiscus syriacus]|uniref:Organic cation/carnitine transporter 2 n=1 Tax=Hibiscus syriacus TaxID=106335 RepID=A0A6A3CWQ7_HIBSY|nr:Organic cation/carnitine transporter 2 [Hibiscus syriacus]